MSTLTKEQLDNIRMVERLQVRADLIAILVDNGILETLDGSAGFWRGEEWVKIYDLLKVSDD